MNFHWAHLCHVMTTTDFATLKKVCFGVIGCDFSTYYAQCFSNINVYFLSAKILSLWYSVQTIATV